MHSSNAGLIHALRQCDEIRNEIGDEPFDRLVARALATQLTPATLLPSHFELLSQNDVEKIQALLDEYTQLKHMLFAANFEFRGLTMLNMLNQLMATLPSDYFLQATYLLASQILSLHENKSIEWYIRPAHLGVEVGPAGTQDEATSTTPLRIFIASTYNDLGAYREAASNEVSARGAVAETAEVFSDQNPTEIADNIRALVRTCNACILLLGKARGSGPFDQFDRAEGLSFTQIEFQEALKTGVPVYTYVVTADMGVRGDQEFIARFREEASSHSAKLQALTSVDQFQFVLNIDLDEVRRKASEPPPAFLEKSRDTTALSAIYGENLEVLLSNSELLDQVDRTLIDGFPVGQPTDTVLQADEHNNQGWEFHISAQYEKALHKYSAAIAACPEFPVVWNNKGLAHYRLNEPELAEAAFLEAIRLAPGFIKPWSNLAIVYLELFADLEGALRWVERALGVDPTYSRALNTLSLIEKQRTTR